MDEFPSGQRGQTVNLLRKLRWSESILVHQIETERSMMRSVSFVISAGGFTLIILHQLVQQLNMKWTKAFVSPF